MNKKLHMGILGLIVWGLCLSVGWAIPKKMPTKQPAGPAQVLDSIQLHRMALRMKQFASPAVPGSSSSGSLRSTSSSILPNQGLTINRQSLTVNPRPVPFRLIRDIQHQTVRFMNCTSPSIKTVDKQPAMTAMQQIGMDFLTQNRSLFKLENPQDELRLIGMTNDLIPAAHLVYQQYYQDTPIWGKQLALHLNAAGEVYACNGGYI
nr:hypothetical protein [Candidatus Delongbacteria bacterium]